MFRCVSKPFYGERVEGGYEMLLPVRVGRSEIAFIYLQYTTAEMEQAGVVGTDQGVVEAYLRDEVQRLGKIGKELAKDYVKLDRLCPENKLTAENQELQKSVLDKLQLLKE
jgi:hypothetical protein